MAANIFDAEIRKYLPLLGNEDKQSLLTIIKKFFILKNVMKNCPNRLNHPQLIIQNIAFLYLPLNLTGME